jgi:hypothetical protein
MNPWLIAGGVAVLASERGRELARKGAVHGLAAVISIGETAVKTAHDATTEAGHAASTVAGTAAHGASAVTTPLTSIVSEAKARAQGGNGQKAPTAARKKRTA